METLFLILNGTIKFLIIFAIIAIVVKFILFYRYRKLDFVAFGFSFFKWYNKPAINAISSSTRKFYMKYNNVVNIYILFVVASYIFVKFIRHLN